MKLCPKCGRVSEDHKKFCNNCGAELSQEAAGEPSVASSVETLNDFPDTKECLSCGRSIPTKAKHCRFCGASTDNKELTKPEPVFAGRSGPVLTTASSSPRGALFLIVGMVIGFVILVAYFSTQGPWYYRGTSRQRTPNVTANIWNEPPRPNNRVFPPRPVEPPPPVQVSAGPPQENPALPATPVEKTEPPNPVIEGLVGYYRLDGDTLDASGNQNNGQASESLVFVSGINNSAARFDGDKAQIVVPENSSLDLNQFTLSAWVNPTDLDDGNRILEKGSSNSYWLDINSEGRLVVGFYAGVFVNTISSTTITTNDWHFVAGTYNGLYLRVFIDGRLDGSKTIIGMFPRPRQTNQPLVIGGKFGGTPKDHFAGMIEEVRIYRRALSDSEIQSLYLATKPPF